MEWLFAVAALLTLALVLGVFYRPLGDYMAWVYTTAKDWRVERVLYRLAGVDARVQQSWKEYLRALLAFSAVGLVLLFLLEVLQPMLPFSLGHPPLSLDLAFNTAASFVANTNWQAYAPEQTVGFAVQMLGLSVQMFVSAAAGMAVAIALVRGMASRRTGTLGNFWVDLVRTTLRILLPLSIIAALVFIVGGVVQNFSGFTSVATVSGGIQSIPGGPVASQEAIKMLGTNGGGFFNANSAHPFENPTAWTNIFQVFLLLLIPFALPRTFATMVDDQRMGYVLLATMSILFVSVFVALTAFELAGAGAAPTLAGAAMEGKEQRFGILGSTLFGAATTGTSGGAANSLHSSYTALGGMVLMLNMMIGEVSPGGVGAGLYAILVLIVLATFLTGLHLGRAPVFLGKRLGTQQIKIVSVFILVMPALALGGATLTLAIPPIRAQMLAGLGHTGPHGVSEIVYAFVSAAINNGSAFAGLDANTPWLNVTLGIIILLGRFIPITLVLALAGTFAVQERALTTVGELPLRHPQFVAFLIAVIALMALPMFVPYLLVGPLAEGLG
ncbi:potassium-transporting ATPase subunit KdpA [Microbacterium protaetiae]|uniref:Potassium-transporting ATPase potassium-binding subunit n=1 Tax=Microbacterium protaetiae TaxID=2509458 RepID=A0A4P6EE59_9MICO|nr:potassium-transporting ATPase subunit KdpA [Microbacterium protaetiae]QAY59643.1 potassium-transporting ATPase subunit KdpA [Microbacterium protaetiae]